MGNIAVSYGFAIWVYSLVYSVVAFPVGLLSGRLGPHGLLIGPAAVVIILAVAWSLQVAIGLAAVEAALVLMFPLPTLSLGYYVGGLLVSAPDNAEAQQGKH